MADEERPINRTYNMRLAPHITKAIEQIGIKTQRSQKEIISELIALSFDAKTSDTAAIRAEIARLEEAVKDRNAMIARQAAQIADLLAQVAALQEHTKGGVFLMPHNR